MKLIVVDDNKTFLNGLIFYLVNVLSYSVIGTARDGLEFLDLKNIHEADIILMDIEMPNLNGIETVERALWRDSDLKFIAITSYTEKTYLDDLLSAGFKSCVFKPNVFDELNDAIKLVIQNKYYFPSNIKTIK